MLSLRLVLAITCLCEVDAEGNGENTAPVAASAQAPQTQNKPTDWSGSTDPEKIARFDRSGGSCDTVSRLPKLLELGVIEIEKR